MNSERELLQEARDELEERKENLIAAEKWAMLPYVQDLIARITAALAAPEPDAMELAKAIEAAIKPQYIESPNGRGGVMCISKDYSEAAALIEAHSKRVPRAEIIDAYESGYSRGENDAVEGLGSNAKQAAEEYAEQYGYRAE